MTINSIINEPRKMAIRLSWSSVIIVAVAGVEAAEGSGRDGSRGIGCGDEVIECRCGRRVNGAGEGAEVGGVKGVAE